MKSNTKTLKGSFWAVCFFYLLIAFEFFYMASPFAVYFYSVYVPGLSFFNNSPVFGWLSTTFLPHFVMDTKSFFLNFHNYIGAFFFLIGLIFFFIGAFQIYYAKIMRKKEVTGGIYKIIRHPQYSALIVSGFGLLILWPRFLALIMYICMLFAYFILAKVEEKECLNKYGESYQKYFEKTNMFIPFKIKFGNNLYPKSTINKRIFTILLFLIALAIGISLGNLLQSYSLNNLYAIYENNNAYISIKKLSDLELNKISEIMRTNPITNKILYTDNSQKHLIYILPETWHIPEIPMNPVNGVSCHLNPSEYDHSVFKIVITQADVRNKAHTKGMQIITNLKSRKPVIEIILDLRTGNVTPKPIMINKTMYQNIPVPVY